MSNIRRRSPSRARPRPGGLTRHRVLAEALVILDAEGLEALTIRRLANQLGVSPMALYNHVRNKEDILEGVAGLLVEQTAFRSDHPDWRERLRDCFRELRNACLAHPSAVQVLEAIEVAPIGAFGPMEIVLTAMRELGMRRDDGLRAYCLLINFTLGQVSYERRDPVESFSLPSHPDRGLLREASRGLNDPEAADNRWDFDLVFEFGLSVILDGLASKAATQPLPPPDPKPQGEV